MSEPPSAPRHALLRPEIAVPFLLVSLIWGSTWYAIKDQLGGAPPSWSVTYRFAIATAGMLIYAAVAQRSLRLTRQGHLLALLLGLFQFCLNFNLVYRGEVHLTSGIVAVLFGLLMVPNALFSRLFLGQPITRRFMAGSLIAVAGIALLAVNEARATLGGDKVALGVALTALSILSASVANVLQASERARGQPLLTMLAFAMLYGTLLDAALAWLTSGPPPFPASPRYWGAVGYLAIIGSVVTFPMYFGLIRSIGPGRAAYTSVAVPVVAMAISTVVEGYRWTGMAVAGAALAMLGMVVAMRGRAVSTPASPRET